MSLVRGALRYYPLNRGRSRITARLRPYATGNPVVPGPEGTRIKLDLSQFPSQVWFWFGSWESEDMRALCARARPGMTAVDVGANIGLFTLALASRIGPGGSVQAFEPDPVNLRLLEENIAINELQGRVTISGKALSDVNGTVLLDPSHDAASSHLSRTGTQVETVRLDDYPLEALHLMKIDVEGTECRVLRGAARTLTRFRPILLVECAERHLLRANASLQELDRALRDLGYTYRDASGAPLDHLPTNANVLCTPD